jgi:hypothetical protein
MARWWKAGDPIAFLHHDFDALALMERQCGRLIKAEAR